MTDLELLEMAAKAAGREPCEYDKRYWNPLTDDGDALRLAVRLNIPVYPYDNETSTGTVGVVAKNWGGKEANTRRAIVRAAAEIGKNLP